MVEITNIEVHELWDPAVLSFDQCTMCFEWLWKQTAIISLHSINWLVFITETECVYCAVRTGSLYTASSTFSNSPFCPHSVFMCFVWIWEQTAIISLYDINWLVFITETQCVYCAVRAECFTTVYLNPVCWCCWRLTALQNPLPCRSVIIVRDSWHLQGPRIQIWISNMLMA
jgi:hypothetical protein